MRPYSLLIEDELRGDTPKEKYQHLLKMKALLKKIGYPRRGTEEERMNIYEAGDEAMELIDLPE